MCVATIGPEEGLRYQEWGLHAEAPELAAGGHRLRCAIFWLSNGSVYNGPGYLAATMIKLQNTACQQCGIGN